MADFATIVLAGGASSRMGQPKALLPFGGEMLIERIERAMVTVSADVVVVSGPHVRLPPLDESDAVRVIEDGEPLQGPLSGIRNGLHAIAHDLCFVCGCDHPFLSPALARFMVERCAASPDAAAAWASWGGSLQPLVGAYRKATVLPVAEAMIASGKRAVLDVRWRTTVVTVTEAELRAIDPTERSFHDVDTPEGYERALRELESVGGRN